MTMPEPGRPPAETNDGSLLARLLSFALRRDHRFALLHLAYGVFVLFTLFMAFQHVPWRDEAGPWMFAREYPLSYATYLTRHEGHPILWFLCVKALESTGMNYLGMMVVNWVFSAAAIWLLFYRSTLPLAARLVVAFAPIMFLEVAFTARDYAIAVLFCFWAAILYRKAEEKPVRFSVVLALLASTNVFAAAVFVGISFQFLLEQAFGFGKRPFSLRPLFARYLGANVILAAGALFLVVQLAPIHFPGDPFPDVTSHLTPHAGNLLRISLFVVFLPPLTLPLFARGAGEPRVFGGWPSVLLAMIPIYEYSGVVSRHLFMIALGVVYFCWIYQDSFIRAGRYFTFRLGATGVKILVTLLIGLAVLAATPKSLKRVFHPPYDSRNASAAIRQSGLDQPGTLLVATDPFRTMPLLLFLKNIREVYVPPQFGPSPQTFANDAYLRYLAENPPALPDIKSLIEDVAAKNPGKTILVVAAGPPSGVDPFASDPEHHLVAIYRTPPWPSPDSQDESYEIYVLK